MSPYRSMPLPKYRRHLPRWAAPIVVAVALAVPMTQSACTPAQGNVLVTGIPADVALVTCVVKDALGGLPSVVAIVADCGGDALEVARILYAAATLPPNAAKGMVSAATNVRSTAAFSDAFHNYPQASP